MFLKVFWLITAGGIGSKYFPLTTDRVGSSAFWSGWVGSQKIDPRATLWDTNHVANVRTHARKTTKINLFIQRLSNK